ncbi:serine hydrolase domain-containing protein [Kineococcus terrestris]|uniref:serine hydrolase domain-containing protein n=1 Tax=Kineococcus terrestris TaxID=2044856 RepID=UPI0034DB5729
MSALRARPARTRARAAAPPVVELPRPTRRQRLTGLLTALALTALALALLPRPPALSADATGDPALAEHLRTATADLEVQGAAAATGTRADGGTAAAVGRADARPGRERAMTAGTPQEIGSVTKSLTGLLLADAVARGEVEPTTTLGEVHPRAGLPADVAGLTLAELATHSSGLPSLGDGRTLRALLANLAAGNPYAGQSAADLLDEASSTRRDGGRGDYAYSNLGFGLLGHALAERAGTPYPQLLDERVLRPLGMADTAVTPDPLPAGRAHEVAANGRAVEPWTSVGSGPAGAGAWSTAADLGRLAAAVAAGTAPGQDAVVPRAPTDQERTRTGWGFFTAEVDTGDGTRRTLLLNNGATAGGASSLVVDPATGEWVTVTTPSAAPTQTIALRLLGVKVPPAGPRERWLSLPVLLTLFLLVLGVGAVLPAALARRARTAAQVPDRLRVLDAVVTAATFLVVVRLTGAWQTVPPALWVAAVALAGLGAGLQVSRWRALEWPRERRARRWAGAGLGFAVVAGLAGAAVLL